MQSEQQTLARENRVKIAVVSFLKEKKTIKQISEETGISTSSIQRYLNDEELIKTVFNKNAEFISEEIKRRLKENKIEGLSLGGTNFAKSNNPTKDKLGRFTGSIRK